MPNIITQIKSNRKWHVVHMGEKRNYRVPIGKPEERRPLARSKNKWKDHTHTNRKTWDGFF